ncbi:MAG: COX15/CtaA family protein [Proteobacteria bacterium]|nr:COX15/CtaA family protein [Pseudomonadota bacterium]
MERHLQSAARSSGREPRLRPVVTWLFVCCALVFAMVVLGGVTRLTESGLSMVDWRPLTGLLPPLSGAEWQDVFAAYQRHPEYQKLNPGMSLEAFKTIYWFEYAHRLLGRAIGLAFLLPFLFFLVTRRVRGAFALKLAGILVLGAAQGLLGWYMVKSGLVDDPRVSPYRLTAHLGLAVAIYGLMFWLALGLAGFGSQRRASAPKSQRGLAGAVVALTFVTLLSGGLVAGNDAGLAYNSFPLMDGRLVPRDYGLLEPVWRNLFENVAAVQFNHRAFAVLLVLTIAFSWFFARAGDRDRRAPLDLLLVMAFVQAGLGIATLLAYVPIPLAALHQAGALLVFTLAVWSLRSLSQPGRLAARFR